MAVDVGSVFGGAGKGAAGGAAVGTVLFPGIGTAVGGALGTVGGALGGLFGGKGKRDQAVELESAAPTLGESLAAPAALGVPLGVWVAGAGVGLFLLLDG